MADTKEKYLKHLDDALQDYAEKLQPDDKVRILSQAVILYSKDRPSIKVKEETGNGVAYDYALPSDWIDGFSYINDQIEYPADDYQNPSYLDESEWMFFKKLVVATTTTYLRFHSFVPDNGKKIRYQYAVPHTVSSSACTIYEIDFEAVVSLAAALCFWALAARFAQSTDSSMEADVVDYQRISDMYKDLAINKMQYYNTLMGKGSDKASTAPANAGVSVKEFDMNYSFGSDYLTHPSSER